MDKKLAATKIIECALPHIPFDGWTQAVLANAAEQAGYRHSDAIRVFPAGPIDAINHYFSTADDQMCAQLATYHLDGMKIREKITLAVRLRIEQHMLHKEALRKAIALQTLPFYSIHGMKNLYRTVDTIWHAIGDNSTDFNFYTKRATLAGVYTATILYWLDDKSAGFEASWGFLDRRIQDVMRIEKLKHQIRQWIA